LIVHLPLCIVLFISILELLSLKNFSKYRAAISAGLYISTTSSIVAVILGLLLANAQDTTGQTLANHKVS
jgi:hypothetical protein